MLFSEPTRCVIKDHNQSMELNAQNDLYNRHIQAGMSSVEISEIVSDRVIAIVRKTFDEVKTNLEHVD